MVWKITWMITYIKICYHFLDVTLFVIFISIFFVIFYVNIIIIIFFVIIFCDSFSRLYCPPLLYFLKTWHTRLEYERGMIRNKCAGQNNFHTNHFQNSIIFGTFLGLVPADLEGLFAAVLLPRNGGDGLVICDVSDYPTPPRLWALLGQNRGQPVWLQFSDVELSLLRWYYANRAASGPFLRLHCLLKSRTEAAAWTLELSLYRNHP